MQYLNFSSITFFYPSRIVGGAEFLFFRLAKYLIDKHNIEVNYIDFHNGVVADMLLKNNLKFNHLYYTGQNTINIDDKSVVISPLSSIYEINSMLNGDFKILLWSIHPSGLYDVHNGYSKYNPFKKSLMKIGEDLEKLIVKKGVYFMDGTNLNYQKDIFKFRLAPEDFMPIFCEQRTGIKKSLTQNYINLGWVGRLSNDKISALINVIHHTIEYATQNKHLNFVIHIIGEGSEKNKIENIVLPKNVEIKFLGTMLDEILENYINKNFDVAFAMGTSALEIGTMRKAVIILDFSYDPIPTDNKFNWLFDSKDFNVAEKYNKKLSRDLSFEEIMSTVLLGNNYATGDLCYEYVIKNHSTDAVGQVVLKSLSQTELTAADLNNTNFRISCLMKRMRFLVRFLKKYL